MTEQKLLARGTYTGERALFQARRLRIEECTFEDGESPLKESSCLDLRGCLFKWKYPLWYGRDIRLEGCTLFENARAGIWYTDNISLENCLIESPKNFRRCRGVSLSRVTFSDARETLWACEDVRLSSVQARGDYFAMNCHGLEAEDFTLIGNYAFDGAKDITVRGARMLTKDAFWNSENVTVIDSFISGEYFGWNAKNLTLVNCTVESLQGFCYVRGLTLKNCRLLNTTLAFEYSDVQAEIIGEVDSVKNPSSGSIVADGFGEVIVEADKVDPAATRIESRGAKSA